MAAGLLSGGVHHSVVHNYFGTAPAPSGAATGAPPLTEAGMMEAFQRFMQTQGYAQPRP